jgi:putative flavoprotein involved in K+ transport
VLRVLFHRVLSLATPIGRRARPKLLRRAAPLVRLKPKDLRRAGVERVGRIAGVRDGRPVLADGRTLDVRNVVWCTGFEPGFGWIDLRVFGPDGEPRHEAGIVPSEPGLYFVGLHFLYSFSSDMIHGVGRDAARIAGAVAARAAASLDGSAAQNRTSADKRMRRPSMGTTLGV